MTEVKTDQEIFKETILGPSEENKVQELIKKIEEFNKPEILNGLELHIKNRDVTSGSIPVQWCLTKELLSVLNRDKITKMLLVVKPEQGKEQRSIVNISDMMSYIYFKNPGEHKITAFLLHDYASRRFILKNDFGFYENDIMHHDFVHLYLYPSFVSEFEQELDYLEYERYRELIYMAFREYSEDKKVNVNNHILTVHSSISVNVPEECFAAKPKDEAWVNWTFDKKLKDQCAFRRRRFFAYSIQPLLALSLLTLRLVVATIVTFFWIKIDWKSLFNIFENFDDFFGDGEFMFWNKGKLKKSTALLIVYIMTSPAVIAMTLICLQFSLIGPPIVWALVFTVIMLAVHVPFILNTLVSAFVFVYSLVFKEENKPLEDELLICNGTGFKQIPFHKKSIKLHYQDLKAKVCKPFAG